MQEVKFSLEKIKKNIISILDRYFNDKYILFLFGSFAKNKTDETSDIDLAIYSEGPIPASKLVEVKEELENKAGTLRNIELVNLGCEELNRALLESILKEGVIWKKPKNSRELLRNLKKRLKNLKR
jgi:predicted nucleotidyltransferase